jgi:hypothetical protein
MAFCSALLLSALTFSINFTSRAAQHTSIAQTEIPSITAYPKKGILLSSFLYQQHAHLDLFLLYTVEELLSVQENSIKTKFTYITLLFQSIREVKKEHGLTFMPRAIPSHLAILSNG